MNINTISNLHSQSYNQIMKRNSVETENFTMPNMDEQSPVEASNPYSKKELRDEDFSFIYNDLTSRARMLPPEIMNSNSLLKFQEAHTAKIVFEFGEDGSIRIKDGLSQADYASAKKALSDYEFWLNGGTLK